MKKETQNHSSSGQAEKRSFFLKYSRICQVIWARKNAKVPHYYNYDLMKEMNENKQMKDVWKLPAIAS